MESISKVMITDKISLKNWEFTLKDSLLEAHPQIDRKRYIKKDIRDLLLIALASLRKTNNRSTCHNIVYSKELLLNPLYKNFSENIKTIEQLISAKDIITLTKYLSKKHENIAIRDAMLDVLNIDHFHLNQNRTNELLFVFYANNTAYFLDIFTHDDFFTKECLMIIHNNWKNTIANLKLKIDALTHENEALKDLYDNKINSIFTVEDELGNKHFYSGRGITSSGHAVKDVMLVNQIQNYMLLLPEWLIESSSQLNEIILEITDNKFEKLDFEIQWYIGKGVCLYETNSKVFFILRNNKTYAFMEEKMGGG